MSAATAAVAPSSSEAKKSTPTTPAKSVSHVPCKFFKAGSCSNGASCGFSHDLPAPGTSKPVCQWFSKGNCRFGHKCALAHIHPGQPMSWDRRNKRTAQAEAREAAQLEAAKQQGDITTPPSSSQKTSTTPKASANNEQTGSYSGIGRSLQNGESKNELWSKVVASSTNATSNNNPEQTGASPPAVNAAREFSSPPATSRVEYNQNLSPSSQIQSNTQSRANASGSSMSGFTPLSPFSASRGLFFGSSSYTSSYSSSPETRASPHNVPSSSYQQGSKWDAYPARSSVSILATGDPLAGDDDAQNCLPSSLSELMTPAELENRARAARSASSGTVFGAIGTGRSVSTQGSSWDPFQSDLELSKSVPSHLMFNHGKQTQSQRFQGGFPSESKSSSLTPPTTSFLSGGQYQQTQSYSVQRSLLAPQSPPSYSTSLDPSLGIWNRPNEMAVGSYSSTLGGTASNERPNILGGDLFNPRHGVGSLPPGLASGLGSLHITPAVSMGETPSSSSIWNNRVVGSPTSPHGVIGEGFGSPRSTGALSNGQNYSSIDWVTSTAGGTIRPSGSTTLANGSDRVNITEPSAWNGKSISWKSSSSNDADDSGFGSVEPAPRLSQGQPGPSTWPSKASGPGASTSEEEDEPLFELET